MKPIVVLIYTRSTHFTLTDTVDLKESREEAIKFCTDIAHQRNRKVHKVVEVDILNEKIVELELKVDGFELSLVEKERTDSK